MKAFILGILLVGMPAWGQYAPAAGPCPDNPALLQPYCEGSSYPQYKHDPPPTYEPNKDSQDFGREMESVRKQQRVNACKAGCPYDTSRYACENRCEQ